MVSKRFLENLISEDDVVVPVRKVARKTKATATPNIKAMKTFVKRAISRREETKTYRFNQTGSYFFPSADFTSFYSVVGDLWIASPHSSFCSIAQGTGESQRIGNQIETVSGKVKIASYARTYDAATNAQPTPFYLKIWIFEVLYDNDVTGVQSVIFNSFMDSNTSSAGLSGLLTDLTGKVNDDIVKLKKTIVRKIGFANNAGTGTSAALQANANNDFKAADYVEIDITKYLRKKYVFNDTNNVPYQPPLFVLCEAIPYNDTVPASTTATGRYSMTIEYNYKDA